MTVDPDERGPRELPLLSPTHGLDGLAKLRSSARLHLDEGDEPVALHDEVNVAMAASEAAHEHAPSLSPQPPLRYPLAQLPERQSLGVMGRQHRATDRGRVIDRSHPSCEGARAER